jgi:HlyD family secretion protein
MTATVDFLVESVDDVLMVSNAALRFRPTQEMIDAVRARREHQREQMPDSVRQRIAERRGAAGGGEPTPGGFPGGNASNGFGRSANSGMLWYLDEDGNVAIARVRTGITDGRSTEVAAPMIDEGLEVITAALEGTQPENNNPFQAQTQRFRPGGF